MSGYLFLATESHVTTFHEHAVIVCHIELVENKRLESADYSANFRIKDA